MSSTYMDGAGVVCGLDWPLQPRLKTFPPFKIPISITVRTKYNVKSNTSMRSMIWTDIGVSFHSAFSPIAPDIDNKQIICVYSKTSLVPQTRANSKPPDLY